MSLEKPHLDYKNGGDPLRIELANAAIAALRSGASVEVERPAGVFKCGVVKAPNGSPVLAGSNGEVYAISAGGDVFVAESQGVGYKSSGMLDPSQPNERTFLALLLDYAEQPQASAEAAFYAPSSPEVPLSDMRKSRVLADLIRGARQQGATLPVHVLVGSRKTPPVDCFVLLPELRPANGEPKRPMLVAVADSKGNTRIAAVEQGRYGRVLSGTMQSKGEQDPNVNQIIEIAQQNLAAFNGDYAEYAKWAEWPQTNCLAGHKQE